MSEKKNTLATVLAVPSGMGIVSGHRVKRSMQVSKYTEPLEGGKGPTRSMWT